MSVELEPALVPALVLVLVFVLVQALSPAFVRVAVGHSLLEMASVACCYLTACY